MFADELDGKWRLLKDGKCQGYWYDEGSNVLLFAFADGIYHLRFSSEGNKKLLKITRPLEDRQCRRVFFRPNDSLVLVACDDVLMYAYYSRHYVTFDDFDENFETVKLAVCDIYSNDLTEVIEVGSV